MEEDMPKGANGRRKSSSRLGDGLGHVVASPLLALRGEAMVEFRSPCLEFIKAIVYSTFDGDINHVFSLL
jgi:hypothetical protein